MKRDASIDSKRRRDALRLNRINTPTRTQNHFGLSQSTGGDYSPRLFPTVRECKQRLLDPQFLEGTWSPHCSQF